MDEISENGELVIAVDIIDTAKKTKLSKEEETYLATLPAERKQWFLDELCRMDEVMHDGKDSIPSRFRILMASLADSAKAIALSRLEAMLADPGSAESQKLKRWMDGLLQVPFGIYKQPMVTLGEGHDAVKAYVARAQKKLSEAVYGHQEPKEKIVQILCQWMANPDAAPLVLGIQGPPGNGKTTLCRKGIAEALDRPFVQLSLGGATDASHFEGHSFTYTGSSWGRLLGCLIDTKCMNPVMFFDELDKVSESAKGEEINGVLIHLTDASQNNRYADKYFDGVPIDFSKALMVFSFNDESKINPVLKDRLTVINTKGFSGDDQHRIARDFLLPALAENVGLEKEAITLESRAACDYAAEHYGMSKPGSGDGGVRGLRQALEACVLQVNKLRLVQDADGSTGDLPPVLARGPRIELPLTLNENLIRQLLPEGRCEKSAFPSAMYI
jgi:ATP-dependent Lon protease